jgi:hypothetical protein
MLNLRAIESFHIGGRSATLRGFQPEHRRLAPRYAPRAINPDGDCVTGRMYAQAFRQSDVFRFIGQMLKGAGFAAEPAV